MKNLSIDLRKQDLSHGHVTQSLKTLLFEQWDHSAVETAYLAPFNLCLFKPQFYWY